MVLSVVPDVRIAVPGHSEQTYLVAPRKEIL
jgi:hypothetical protein